MSAASGAGPLSEHQQLEAYKNLVDTLNGKIDAMNTPLWQKYTAYQAAQYDEQTAFMQHRIAVFRWQEHASNVMLWVVVAVVLCGLVFSAVQLAAAVRLGRDSEGNLEIGAQGLKITSSVIGLFVLAMSIAFVVIFVDQIYSIQVVHLSGQTAPLGKP
jgi:hypothetical protein